MTELPKDAGEPEQADPSVLVHVDIAAGPDRVWDALVTEGGLGAWMGEGASLDPRPGGVLSFPDPVGGRKRDGRVTTVIEQEQLGYTWWTADRPSDRSAVTITLDPIETGTRVTVIETAMPRHPVGFTLRSAGRASASSSLASAGKRAGTSVIHARSSSLIGLWSWRLAMVTMASQMVRV